MPRLHGYRERVQIDMHIHVADLTSRFYRELEPNPSDQTIVLVDVSASRPDVTISFDVGTKRDLLVVTGPWLTGRQTESTIMDILMIANDAVIEGKTKSTMEILSELVDRTAKSDRRMGVLRPIIVPVRQRWGVQVQRNEGAPCGPVDIWLRTLHTRDVA